MCGPIRRPVPLPPKGFDTTISSVASEDGGVAIYTSGGVTRCARGVSACCASGCSCTVIKAMFALRVIAAACNGTCWRYNAPNLARLPANTCLSNMPPPAYAVTSLHASSGVAVQSLWRQWYAKYRISNVSTAIDQLATSPNLIATTRVALNITRQGLFRHPDIQITSSSGSPSAPSSSPTLSPSSTSSTTWVNVDETAVDLASGPAVAQLPDSFSPRWVRSQSWVTISGADEAMFLTGGYYQADEGYDVTVGLSCLTETRLVRCSTKVEGSGSCYCCCCCWNCCSRRCTLWCAR